MPESILQDLESRGMIAQISDREGLFRHLSQASRTLYAGFDPSADSLHIGSLVPLLALRRFQLHGHRPIALVGGATGLIGDPSFKNTERKLTERDLVGEWVVALRRQISRFIDLEGNSGGIVVDNLDWTRNLDVISFLRDIGKHFSVNAMTQKDSVRARLEREGAGISFTEFSYILLQSMDYLELARRYGCTLQVGGTDQWGNITSGMDLVRRVLGREAFALTFPLVTQADGTKFGKTEAGTVWLDRHKTSPYAFYQFWVNVADADVLGYLNWFTFLEREEIAALARGARERPERREAQRKLAQEVTRLVHGDDAVRSAERISQALFSGEPEGLSADDFDQLHLDGMPFTALDSDEVSLVEILESSGLTASRSSARKLIESRGVYVNGLPVTQTDAVLERRNALHGRFHVLRRGKKVWHLVAHESRY